MQGISRACSEHIGWQDLLSFFRRRYSRLGDIFLCLLMLDSQMVCVSCLHKHMEMRCIQHSTCWELEAMGESGSRLCEKKTSSAPSHASSNSQTALPRFIIALDHALDATSATACNSLQHATVWSEAPAEARATTCLRAQGEGLRLHYAFEHGEGSRFKIDNTAIPCWALARRS